jgi:D-alanyl-lipoteichoic acid acyltransferase DltB (MBOAT superfamily)
MIEEGIIHFLMGWKKSNHSRYIRISADAIFGTRIEHMSICMHGLGYSITIQIYYDFSGYSIWQ